MILGRLLAMGFSVRTQTSPKFRCTAAAISPLSGCRLRDYLWNHPRDPRLQATQGAKNIPTGKAVECGPESGDFRAAVLEKQFDYYAASASFQRDVIYYRSVRKGGYEIFQIRF
jgi:hypothetical protein